MAFAAILICLGFVACEDDSEFKDTKFAINPFTVQLPYPEWSVKEVRLGNNPEAYYTLIETDSRRGVIDLNINKLMEIGTNKGKPWRTVENPKFELTQIDYMSSPYWRIINVKITDNKFTSFFWDAYIQPQTIEAVENGFRLHYGGFNFTVDPTIWRFVFSCTYPEEAVKNNVQAVVYIYNFKNNENLPIYWGM